MASPVSADGAGAPNAVQGVWDRLQPFQREWIATALAAAKGSVVELGQGVASLHDRRLGAVGRNLGDLAVERAVTVLLSRQPGGDLATVGHVRHLLEQLAQEKR